jgi:hypothetical protein
MAAEFHSERPNRRDFAILCLVQCRGSALNGGDVLSLNHQIPQFPPGSVVLHTTIPHSTRAYVWVTRGRRNNESRRSNVNLSHLLPAPLSTVPRLGRR